MDKLLIHVGHHKTGTTWLQKFVWNNSQIGFQTLAKDKELTDYLLHAHPLDFDIGHANKLKPDKNSKIYSVISKEALGGNPHCGGYNNKQIADYLKQLFPNAKIFIVIREQQKMILSTYKQYVKIGGVVSLKDYLNPPGGKSKLPLFEFSHFQYHRLISYYFELFGKNNVLVLPYEMLQNSPQEFVRRILSMCNIVMTECNLPYHATPNKSTSAAATSAKRIANRLVGKQQRVNLAPLLPIVNNRKLKYVFSKFDRILPQFFRDHSDKKYLEIIKKYSQNHYQLSNQHVVGLTNLDLAKYNYEM